MTAQEHLTALVAAIRAETLRAVAEEVRIRGDVGQLDGPTVENFLNAWADVLEGVGDQARYAELRERAIQDLLKRREARIGGAT